MKKVALLIALVMVLVMVVPAAAITYGEPDEGEHPYVGLMIFFDAVYDYPNGGWFSCSGALLDSKTLLTAGHCTIDVGTDLQVTPGGFGGRDMWVTFEEVDVLAGFPSSADYPDPADKNEARFEWLQKNKTFIRGTSWPHPEYGYGFPNTRDVGIVVLDKPAKAKSFVELPELGVLDELATRRGHNKQLFETSGYGIQEIVPFFQSEDSRYKATSSLVELGSALTDGYNLHTSNNPGKGNGIGGACFGDSGGPVMFNNTNIVVAVVSFGLNYNCKGADYGYRVDISESQDFILPFLD
ncbi:MAG: trypsin-like serine protease [Anaerolineales bacterium]|nr:trypsin-like serine protease [Anaerolineales bacterium]